VAGYALSIVSGDARADGPPKDQLSSIPECNRKYARHVLAQSKNGLECFWGQRKDLDPKYPIGDQLHIFDMKNLQVWPLVSEQISKHADFKWGWGSAAVFDSSATKLAVTPVFFVSQGPYSMVLSCNIVLIDLKTLNCELIVADGWLNYNPSFSPDGR